MICNMRCKKCNVICHTRRSSGNSYILVGTGFLKSVSQLVTLSEFDREYKIILTKYVGQMFCHVHFTHYVTSIVTYWDIMQYIICSRTALVSKYTLQILCLRTAPCQLESVEPRKRLLCTYKVQHKDSRKASISSTRWSISCLCF